MSFVIFGYSGFIGKNLVKRLDIENKQYVLIHRNDFLNINIIKNKIINLKNITIIYLIHDFKNNNNNITIIKKVINIIKNNNIIINKFIYLSSWVTTFNICDYDDDEYIKSKKIIEKYLNKLNNFKIIIIRPPLVIGNNSQFQPFINILLLTLSPYFLHVDELCYHLINLNIDNKFYNIPSYIFSNNNFLKNIDNKLVRNIIPKSFSFIFFKICFPISNIILSKSMVTEMKIETEIDCIWALKYLINIKFVAKNQAVRIQKKDNNNYQIISLEKYSNIIYNDDFTIKVQSGTTFKILLEYLAKFNKTIKHLPEYSDLSVSACIMTQIHGSSFYYDDNSSLCASCIKSIVILKKINNEIIRLNILNDDNDFVNILFNTNYNNGNFCIIEVEFYIINNITLYKIYNIIKIPNKINKLYKHIHKLLLNNINLTIQYNSDSSDTLCFWKISKNPFNNKNIRKPSFLLRRHVNSILRRNILYPFDMEVDTYTNILCQYKNTMIETIGISIINKLEDLLVNSLTNIIAVEFTCNFNNFIYIFLLLLKYKPNSIGIRFLVVCELLEKKYKKLKKNEILCWFEILIDNKNIENLKKELINYIYFYHNGKYIL